MSRALVASIAFVLIGACSEPAAPSSAAQQLAVACAIDVETAAKALAANSSVAGDAGPGPDGGIPGGPDGGGPPTDGPPDDDVPTDGPPDEDPPGLDLACCDDPDGCTPMIYPDDVCQELGAPVDSTELARHSTVDYVGEGTTTAFFANCEPPPDEECDPDATPYVFAPYPQTRWVAAFVDDGNGGVDAELYSIPEGSTTIRIPSGAQVFPLLPGTDGFADLTRPVETPDGTLYVDKQNDCIPRADGCGFTCFTC